MSLFVSSLNSGSNGNCYYIGNATEAILVDAGITCADIEKRMDALGLPLSRVKALFISHEHTDHVKGAYVFTKKYQVPIYITGATAANGRVRLEKQLLRSFEPHTSVNIGSLSITGFPKFHDAADPYSFVIECNNICVGVFTDIGRACNNVITYFKQCHAVFLEANYCEKMLEEGRYPFFLKNRIRGGNGHLSNREALEIFTVHRPAFMSHLFLAHLSKNNNCPKLVEQLFNDCCAGVKVIVASRYQQTPLYCIDGLQQHQLTQVRRKKLLASQQLALAFA